MVAVARPHAEVRAMRREDLPGVAALERAAYDFPWSEGIFGDCLKAGHPAWVLWVEGEMAGYGVLSVAAGEAHVLNLCISQNHRGLGLGRHLLRRLLDVARWNGAEDDERHAACPRPMRLRSPARAHQSRLAMYQAIVSRSPCSRLCFGRQPSSVSALVGSMA